MSALLRLLLLVAALVATPASAHLSPNSEVGLAFGRSTIDADIVIPLGELRYAETAIDPADKARLGAWLLGHVEALAPDGRRWTAQIVSLGVGGDVVPDLEARIRLTPPPGAPLRRLSLRYDAVLDKVPSHFALVWLKDDYDGGRLGVRPALLAGLRQGNATVAIDRGAPSGWAGFRAAITLGMEHIAEGHDHLLFLIGLLLPAPLLASAGRWRGYAGARHTIRSLVAIVTAFTIGHSLTLIGGALFDWQLPAQPVEALIALSILITAVHGLRPLFAGREALVAAGFGLVHGLAFATIIGHFALDPWPKAQAILGFNLGIELVQLLVVSVLAPPLALLARTAAYRPIRIGGSLVIGVAALLWLAERLGNRELAAARFVDEALGRAPYVLVPLLLLSLLFSVRRTSGNRPPRNHR